MAIVEDAAAGMRATGRGATILQLRLPGAAGGRLEREAQDLVARSAIPVLVNDRCDVALAAGAAGVHLPESGLPVAAARRLLGAGRLVGRSVHSLEAARAAQAEGADYVLWGPVFATPTHPGRPPLGLEALRRLCAAVNLPVLAVGGVTGERARECREAGAAGFAGIREFA